MDNKYSVLKSVAVSLWTVSDKFTDFIKTAGVFALFLTVLSYIFGQTYVCVFMPEKNISLPCLGNSLIYFPYLIVKLLVINFFIIFWFKKILWNQSINKTLAARSSGMFFLFVIFNLMPLVSAVLLLIRKANPVWQIELLYFTIVSIGFLLPFVLMRFYAVFAGVLENSTTDLLKKVWVNTGGYSAKIIISAIIVYSIALLTVISVNSVIFRFGNALPLQMYNLIAEYVFNFMALFSVALIADFIDYQKQVFLK